MKISRQNGSYLHDSYSGLIDALAAQGKLEEASALAEEALKSSRERAEPSWISQHAAELGSIELERGRLAEAGRLLAESLEIRRRLREYTIPESEILIAQLRLEERQWEEARRLAREASEQFAAAGRKADQASADAVEAEALLLAGRRNEARNTVEAASLLLEPSASPDARVPVLLARVRITNALGEAPAARSDVQTAARLAGNLAWKNLVLETRLAAAEIDGGSGAATVAADARAMGFERIARHADRLAKRGS